MRKVIFIIVLGICLNILVGCNNPGATFDLGKRRITIITDPPGAQVLQIDIADQQTNLGTTPLNDQSIVVITRWKKFHNMPYNKTQELMKASGGNVKVVIKKEGYETYTGYLSTSPAETTVHEIKLVKKMDRLLK